MAPNRYQILFKIWSINIPTISNKVFFVRFYQFFYGNTTICEKIKRKILKSFYLLVFEKTDTRIRPQNEL